MSATETTCVVTINALPDGPNQKSRSWKVNAGRRAKLNKAVFKGWMESGAPRAQGRPARIKVRFFVRGPIDDEDNRVARCKAVIDQLVLCGAFVDDDEKHLTWAGIPTRSNASGPPYMEIEIEYLDRSDSRAGN